MKVMVLSLYWLVIYEASWKSIWKELVRFDGVCCWFWWQIHFSGAMKRILVPYFVMNLLPFYIKNLLYYFLVDEIRMYSKYTPDNFASHYSSKFNYGILEPEIYINGRLDFETVYNKSLSLLQKLIKLFNRSVIMFVVSTLLPLL